MDIVIKNMYDAFGMLRTSGQIMLGDVRKQFTASFLRSLEKLIDKHQDKEKYHILVHSRFDAVGKRRIKTVCVILPGEFKVETCKTIGTMCFTIDNKSGTFTKRWVLPMDRIQLANLNDPRPKVRDEEANDIVADAAGMPVKGLVLSR